ncbi:MAG TPA: tetratricopeptide repeat protein [Asanoa sp.]|nr:tetratricopeptide repeat protein [Asanoa sp.]
MGRLLTDRRMLIVLDNARDAEQVRPLLPGAAGCLALVTSRDQMSGLVAAEGAHILALDLLSVTEAQQLMRQRLGDDRVSPSPDAINDIITSCARLPIALAIAAARAASRPDFPIEYLAKELADARGGLESFSGPDIATDLRAVFTCSYRTLRPETTRVFRALSVHPGPDLAAPTIASLAGVAMQRIQPMLAELTEAHLLTEHTPGRYVLHDLLRAYAAELLNSHNSHTARHGATRRLLDHYLHTAHTAALLLHPNRDPISLAAPLPGVTVTTLTTYAQAMAWFTSEHAALVASLDRATETGLDVHASRLAWSLEEFFYLRENWHDYAASQTIALGAVRRLGDTAGQAHTHRTLASAYIQQGRVDDARVHFQRSIDLYGELSDLVGQGHAHRGLSWLYQHHGPHEQALRHAEESLVLFQAAQHHSGLALALNNIGWVHALLGDYRTTLTYCWQALTIQQQISDAHGQANTWDSLGYANHHLGHYRQAIACYEHALDLRRKAGHRTGIASTLVHIGHTHHMTGDRDAAREAWHHALVILDELDLPDADSVRDQLSLVS